METLDSKYNIYVVSDSNYNVLHGETINQFRWILILIFYDSNYRKIFHEYIQLLSKTNMIFHTISDY